MGILRFSISIAAVVVLAFALKATQAGAVFQSNGSGLPASNQAIPTGAASLVIDPPDPTTNDVIQITASGQWPNSCVPEYQSYRIEGNKITIEASPSLLPPVVCLQLPTWWQFTVDVGPLPAGLYQIRLSVPGSITTAHFAVTQPPLIDIDLQADPSPVQAGLPLTYTLRVTNNADVDLHATITNTLPAQTTPTGRLVWTPTLTAAGGFWTGQVVVTAPTGYTGSLRSTVEMTTQEGLGERSSISVCVNVCVCYLPAVFKR